jgi:3-isopropylmalate/(R)-2-methylmalate dehydratase small subunit
MSKINNITGFVLPLDKKDVDTDQIIPQNFLKAIDKKGFGKNLFHGWRFNALGESEKKFVLNNPIYKNSKILLTRENFGCGSSREHAVWALKDYGFKVIISSSFADIFYSNCLKNFVLPIILSKDKIEYLFNEINNNQYEITVNLTNQIITNSNLNIKFEIDNQAKNKLINELDDIDITLKFDSKITEYEKNMIVYIDKSMS